MLGIGGAELVIIGLFALLIFGPERLPELGRTAGKALKQFKDAQEEMTQIIRDEVYDPEKDGALLQDFQNLVGDFSLEAKPSGSKPKAYSSTAETQFVQEQASVQSSQELLESFSHEAAPQAQASGELEISGESFAEKKARLVREKEEKLKFAQELYADDFKQGDDA